MSAVRSISLLIDWRIFVSGSADYALDTAKLGPFRGTEALLSF